MRYPFPMRRWSGPIVALAACLLTGTAHAALAAAVPALAATPLTETAIAKRHMIVAAEPDAADAGLAMLRAGGSAVDAAIAAQLVLGLVEPQSSGIGGGAFMLVADGANLRGYDGRETAPASARPDMFLRDGAPRPFRDVQYGGLPVGVPGTIAMLAMAHKAHGKLPWARLFDPAILLAERGFMVQPRLSYGARDQQRLPTMPDMRAYLYHADGTPVLPGETLRNPAYADALRKIAAGGPDGFYKGAVADQIAAAVSNAPVNPVPFSLTDLSEYRAKEREPMCGLYRSYRVCGMPPATSGGVTVLQILGMLERFPSSDLRPRNALSVHLISEASRLAYADRERWLGDPDFVDIPTAALVDRFYINGRSRLINPARSMGTATSGTPPMRQGQLDFAPQRQDYSAGTSHFSVVDENGLVVAMTTSVQAAFGAGVMAGGFVLNNQLTDFSFEPVIGDRPAANAPAAGKRPLSSMSPTIVFTPDGKFFASLGSPGGRQIIGYVAQAISGLVDRQLSMPEVSAQPRHINLNGATTVEAATDLEALEPELTSLGHQVRINVFESGVNGIRGVPGGFEGGADPRREGVARGD